MIKKVYATGPLARKKLLKGALEVGKLVSATLGPSGRNCILQVPYSAPNVTNDGVTIARNIALDDVIEDLGAQTVVEACMKTNERAGDGTTTTATIACALIEQCAEQIEEEEGNDFGGTKKANVVGMSKAILEGSKIVVEKLKGMAKPVKKGDIKNIITTSLGKLYPQYIDPVTDMLEKVGADGYVSIEDNWATKYGVETEMKEGMRFLGSYVSPLMITDQNKNEVVVEDPYILVTNYRIEATAVFNNILKQMSEKKKTKLVVICEGFDKRSIEAFNKSFISLMKQGKEMLQFVAVKAPSLTTDQLHDVALSAGTNLIDKNNADNLEMVTLDRLGTAKKVVIDENDTLFLGGKGEAKHPVTGKKEKVADRIAVLKIQVENEKDLSFKEQTKRRIGALTAAFGIIRVGAATEQEQSYIKYKIEDAVNAAKAAMAEGIVQGGGLALKAIADELGEKHILYKALNAPHETIKLNAGGDIKIPATVIDPVKVTRFAVENACSVSAQMISAESAISSERKTLWGEMEKKLAPRDEEDDFRDDANVDKPYRT